MQSPEKAGNGGRDWQCVTELPKIHRKMTRWEQIGNKKMHLYSGKSSDKSIRKKKGNYNKDSKDFKR